MTIEIKTQAHTQTSSHINNISSVVVGLSGGVDSSVTALLLKQQGLNVSAIFMKNWNEDDDDGYCPAEEDFADAQSIAAELDIPFHGVNFAPEYWDNVFAYFLSEYQAGRTPNPDILCNKEIKFKVFLDYALSQGAQKIATGHYARVKEEDGQFYLLKGKDNNKDQSYFLYTLGQYPLSRTLFPVGELDKTEVRHLAEKYHLATWDKKDSTGICFIGERDFNKFLSQYMPAKPGNMVTPEGEVVGQHQGLMYHTLGQRKGLGIGGRKSDNSNFSQQTAQNAGQPWFAAQKNMEKNQLIVVQGKDHPLLYSKSLSASKLHWVSGKAPQAPFQCMAKTRYRQPDQACTITSFETKIPETGNNNTENYTDCVVEFDTPQFAVTPGQSVVFYQDEICLGGGIIN
ncbi:MAG: tRNA 2-thiouridine(34) synthase MnmA [gamma proteobacterium symbiont of Bathyaustriella thionipta]|nr:tRNA 2-thiouridine(34) synthase MnmA [gamma proteobacterium symbiont of Bathyaustriella thionipta]MCU7948878.1 tRNA 2-thiouridine(34) synthase MnmA [gamma proteobacterium symbiont of Bathyaustriella thionipta]MCU7952380.1 tRNA 2-thiouridine(34) synthase MnmA [gamma proteobacterium symbiont of Bathyaustriella thionipta]MCU7955335.1 tRNA 2-thiouridine(34) synthase MnmA [gamma proteobacterium symbiont of Bathyaustriella thionipta]MCU7966117.1 tRNA 2-thiouridine(34) synthase MnmA [gamma proteoba